MQLIHAFLNGKSCHLVSNRNNIHSHTFIDVKKQQMLPSNSLYEQYVFSKGEQQKSCLTHISQSKKASAFPEVTK